MEKQKKKKLGCLIAFLVIAAIIGVLIFLGVSAAKQGMQMMQAQPTYGEAEFKDLSSYVNLSGIVSSSETVNVTTEMTRKVKTLNIKVGDSVKKGDILCILDSEQLQEQFDKLTNNADKAHNAENYKSNLLRRNLNDAKNSKTNMLNKAQEAVNRAVKARDDAYEQYNAAVEMYNQLIEQIPEADEETAKTMQKKADDLQAEMEKAYPTLAQLDEAITEARNAYRDTEQSADQVIQSAQDAIDAEQYSITDDSADEQLKTLQEQIDNCTITAPADGVVTQLNVSVGSIPMSNTLMVIENTDSLVVKGKVNESDILRVEEKMPCEIKTSATEDEVIQGSVKRIERIISSYSDAAASGYTVEISIDDPKSKLLIGMSASVKIVLNKKEHVLSVPYDAINGGENDGYFVLTCEPTDQPGMVKVVKKPVNVGFEGDYFTEITDTDIQEGDLVFTPTEDKLGMPITVEEGQIIPDPKLKAGLKEKK